MVMGVCRQILRGPHDADDAFQATFLVLVRKAGSIRVRESLAPWLYGVAYRTAQRARANAARYRSAPAEQLEEPMASSADDTIHFDVRPLLHEELNRLPGKYRDPIVLCHLEGKTHEEAARLLKWPIGTVSGRLSRGRDLLRSRLERRGLEVSPAALTANWLAGTPTGVTLPLIDSTVGAAFPLAAAQAVSTSVLSLTEGVLNSMLLNKIKTTAFIVLLVGGVTAGAGVWAIQASQSATRASQPGEAGSSGNFTKAEVKALRKSASPLDALQKGLVASPQMPGGGMGMSFPPPLRLKNAPEIDNSRGLVSIRTESMVLVESPDRSAWKGMSFDAADHPRWSEFRFRPGTTASPLANSDVAALMIKGKTIDYVAAFSAFTGNWVPQKLRKPAEDEINPVLGRGYALYQSGNDFYAFTARKGYWGVLQLDGNEDVKVTTSAEDIEVLHGNKLYVFSVKQGEWSDGVAIYVPPPSAAKKQRPATDAQKPLQ
jgi:RNA polymerase sigma factor (sigma-70 family)